jgi:hypothetical protein
MQKGVNFGDQNQEIETYGLKLGNCETSGLKSSN